MEIHKLNTKFGIIWLLHGRKKKQIKVTLWLHRPTEAEGYAHCDTHGSAWHLTDRESGRWDRVRGRKTSNVEMIVTAEMEKFTTKWFLGIVCEFYWWWCDDVESSAAQGPALTSGNKNSKKRNIYRRMRVCWEIINTHITTHCLRSKIHMRWSERACHVERNTIQTLVADTRTFSVAELKFKTIGIGHKNSHTFTHTVGWVDELAHHKYGFYWLHHIYIWLVWRVRSVFSCSVGANVTKGTQHHVPPLHGRIVDSSENQIYMKIKKRIKRIIKLTRNWFSHDPNEFPWSAVLLLLLPSCLFSFLFENEIATGN